MVLIRCNQNAMTGLAAEDSLARFPASRYVALAYAAADRYLVRLTRPSFDVETARRGTMCLGELADSVAGGIRHEPQEGAVVHTRHDATT